MPMDALTSGQLAWTQRVPHPLLVLLLILTHGLPLAQGAPPGFALQPQSDSCNISAQRTALVSFYSASSPLGWKLRDGWSAAAAHPPSAWGHVTWNCTQDDAPALLPDTCCWPGITCCTSANCTLGQDPATCGCMVGATTGISLANNNLRVLQGGSFSPLSCSLNTLFLGHNSLAGPLGQRVELLLSVLTRLEFLDLSANMYTGTLPDSIVPSLKYLNIMNNQLSGSMPANLCPHDPGSPSSSLLAILISGNEFSGSLDVSSCGNLVTVMAERCQLDSFVVRPSSLYSIQSLYLNDNRIRGRIDQQLAGTRTLMDLKLSNNALTGPLPEDILLNNAGLQWLNLARNRFTGTIPSSVFELLSNLNDMDVSNNLLTGPLPESIGLLGTLTAIWFNGNMLTGPIPDTLFQLPSIKPSSGTIDMQHNLLSCCLLNVSSTQGGGLSYLGVRESALLPRGVQFSTQLRIMDSTRPDLEGMSCPFLRLDSYKPTVSYPILLDPEYYLFQECICRQGYLMTNTSHRPSGGAPGLLLVRCQEVVKGLGSDNLWVSQPWVTAALIVGILVALGVLVWWLYRVAGLYWHKLGDMRKRVVGPPEGGPVSIVVTDIEGFTDLMRVHPELTISALHLHNSVMRDAKWRNFGFVLEEEGDSYALVFRAASDAVKFCLQVQLALERVVWPAGLSLGAGRAADAADAGPAFAPGRSSSRRLLSFFTSRSTSRLHAPTPADDASQHSSPRSPPTLTARSVTSRSLSNWPRPASLDHSWHNPRDRSRDRYQGPNSPRQQPPERQQQQQQQRQAPAPEPGVEEELGSRASWRSHSWMRRPGTLAKEPLQRKSTKLLTDQAHTGLRVRMGIVTGVLPLGCTAIGSQLMDLAKVISDAANGGQVFMCSSTFREVQHLARELGCVNHQGLDCARLQASRRFPWSTRKHVEDVFLLDMGIHVRPAAPAASDPPSTSALPPPRVPLILKPSYLHAPSALPARPTTKPDLEGSSGSRPKGTGGTNNQRRSAEGRPFPAPSPSPAPAPAPAPAAFPAPSLTTSGVPPTPVHGSPLTSTPQPAAAEVPDGEEVPGSSSGLSHLHLFQVLASPLAARGQAFGSAMRLSEEWQALDVPYFSAPGAMSAPLHSSTSLTSSCLLPQVVMVFCTVEGGWQYSSWNRRDGRQVDQEMLALLYTLLRQVPGGYFVKHYSGELKYMVAFSSAEMALIWCLAVQECAMYVDWPASALRQWQEERDNNEALVFRGPRLKMGMSSGHPTSIVPDHVGRADYHGPSINQAARYTDAAAHGGQIVCEQALAEKVLGSWASRPLEAFMADPSPPSIQPKARRSSPPAPWPPSIPFPGPDHPPPSGHHCSAVMEEELSAPGLYRTCQLPASLAPPSPTDLDWVRSLEGAGSEEGRRSCRPRPVPPRLPQVELQLEADDGMQARLSEKLDPRSCVTGLKVDVRALQLGMFRFKGISEQVPLVHVTSARLLGRMFPLVPPKGKGSRVSEASGECAAACTPLLTVVAAYRLMETQRGPRPRASMQQPRRPRKMSFGPAAGVPGPLMSLGSLNRRDGLHAMSLHKTSSMPLNDFLRPLPEPIAEEVSKCTPNVLIQPL